MKKTNKAIEVSKALSSRYDLEELDCEDWSELTLFGGIGMNKATFTALASVAGGHGDMQATIYELETTQVEFEPVSIDLEFRAFNQLKGDAISHFEVVMIPSSRNWAAVLTSELETIVLGEFQFLNDLACAIPKEYLSDERGPRSNGA